MECKVCSNTSNLLFKAKILNKYTVSYYKCTNCGFVNTEEPFWLDEAYNDAITFLDIGLISRNIQLSNIVKKLLVKNFNPQGNYLDYAGGYGIFVRLMRDYGYNYFRQDTYCENLFAKNFDTQDAHFNIKNFELITAFEVFEHLQNPKEILVELLKKTDNILISTLLIPNYKIQNETDWWYFVPEIGQHISFYSLESLEYLAQELNLFLYSNNEALHLFTKKRFKENPLLKPNSIFNKIYAKIIFHVKKLKRKNNLESLQAKDLNFLKKINESII